jgi:EmrB/QacA subfamily drug resistance transporter
VSASTLSADPGGSPKRLGSMRSAESRRWWALVAVSLAAFMTYLDNNIVNVAIPTIQRSLHLSVSGLEWVVSSYLLTLAALLLVGGRLADVFGRRRLLLVGLAVFTLSSLAAGLAGSGGVLIASRAIQGIGAALLMPPTLAIIVATFTNVRERNMAVGIWAAVGALALALGPVLGGLISQHARWGWIFLINVPVGVITFALALLSVSESRASSAVRRLDVPGLVTSAVSLFALTYALIEGNVRGWTSPLILGAFALATVTGAGFLAIESRTANPMVPLTMFRRREFSGGTGTMMIWAFGIFGIYFFTSLYLQLTLGFSPVKAGLAFVPMALCIAVFAGIAPRVEAWAGAHRTVAFGMLLMLVGLILFARLGLHAGYASLLPGFMLFGAGAGLMNVPLTNAVMHATPPARAGIASALLNASREVAGLLGITVIGAVLRTWQTAALRAGAGPVHAFVDGYHAGLLLAIALLAIGVLISYLTLRPRGAAGPADQSAAAGEPATADEPVGAHR